MSIQPMVFERMKMRTPAVAKRLGFRCSSKEPAISDIADPRFRESYFKDVHYQLEEQGVDFWWD